MHLLINYFCIIFQCVHTYLMRGKKIAMKFIARELFFNESFIFLVLLLIPGRPNLRMISIAFYLITYLYSLSKFTLLMAENGYSSSVFQLLHKKNSLFENFLGYFSSTTLDSCVIITATFCIWVKFMRVLSGFQDSTYTKLWWLEKTLNEILHTYLI